MRLPRPSWTQGIRMQAGANFDGTGALPGRQERTIRQFWRYRPGAGESGDVPWTSTAPSAAASIVMLPSPNENDAEEHAGG